MENMENVKNTESQQGNNQSNAREFAQKTLAAVGAFALVKAAPVLVAGIAIGAAFANADKINEAMTNFAAELKEEAAKSSDQRQEDSPFDGFLFVCRGPVTGEGETDAERQEPAADKANDQ